jgi:putative oxidoreductase
MYPATQPDTSFPYLFGSDTMQTATSNSLLASTGKIFDTFDYINPLFDLALRLWVANVFFKSGLVKIQSWESTLMLFEYEYSVPILPFDVAAYLATATELAIPVLLVIGLGSRLSALILFVLNYVAAIAYPDISAAGLKDHFLWGTMLAVTFFHGPGKLSVDHWLTKRLLG